MSSAEDKQASALNIRTGFGNVRNDGSVLMKLLPKGLASRIRNALNHEIESQLRDTNGPHAMMNATRPEQRMRIIKRMLNASDIPESPLDDLEASAPAQHEVAQGHSNVVVNDFKVALWGVVVSVDSHWANEFHSGGVSWDDDDALLLVRVGVCWVRLAHNDVYLRPRITCATNPPAETLVRSRSRTGDGSYHLWPLMTISFPSLRIEVLILVASDEGTNKCRCKMNSQRTGKRTRRIAQSY